MWQVLCIKSGNFFVQHSQCTWDITENFWYWILLYFFMTLMNFPVDVIMYSSDVFSVSLDAGWFSQYSKALCRFFSLFILTKSRKWFRILVCDVLYKKIYPLYKDFYLKIRHPIMNIYHSELVSILRLFIVHQLGRETFIYMVCMYCEYSSLNYILYM